MEYYFEPLTGHADFREIKGSDDAPSAGDEF
jgi:hypothetical protein